MSPVLTCYKSTIKIIKSIRYLYILIKLIFIYITTYFTNKITKEDILYLDQNFYYIKFIKLVIKTFNIQKNNFHNIALYEKYGNSHINIFRKPIV